MLFARFGCRPRSHFVVIVTIRYVPERVNLIIMKIYVNIYESPRLMANIDTENKSGFYVRHRCPYLNVAC